MKAELEIITNDDGNKVVLLSKSLKGLTTYEELTEIENFKKNDIKRLEYGVDFVIRDILGQYGIIPNESNKEGLQRAFDTLKSKYHIQIKIADCYSYTEERVLYHKHDLQSLITIIQDYDHTISCANEIVVESCD